MHRMESADSKSKRKKPIEKGWTIGPHIAGFDEESSLPYGLGFDKFIKKKTDLIESQKFQNNRIMDLVVEKLGYMDYRDALVCNKYILEAKRSKDYHQVARAKVLQHAFQQYNSQRREEIEAKARE
jgi:hypothetical protein